MSKCPNCGSVETSTAVRQGRRGDVNIIDVGYRCQSCGHEWGFDIFKDGPKVIRDTRDKVLERVDRR